MHVGHFTPFFTEWRDKKPRRSLVLACLASPVTAKDVVSLVREPQLRPDSRSAQLCALSPNLVQKRCNGRAN
jgi:hypothetical protein